MNILQQEMETFTQLQSEISKEEILYMKSCRDITETYTRIRNYNKENEGFSSKVFRANKFLYELDTLKDYYQNLITEEAKLLRIKSKTFQDAPLFKIIEEVQINIESIDIYFQTVPCHGLCFTKEQRIYDECFKMLQSLIHVDENLSYYYCLYKNNYVLRKLNNCIEDVINKLNISKDQVHANNNNRDVYNKNLFAFSLLTQLLTGELLEDEDTLHGETDPVVWDEKFLVSLYFDHNIELPYCIEKNIHKWKSNFKYGVTETNNQQFSSFRSIQQYSQNKNSTDFLPAVTRPYYRRESPRPYRRRGSPRPYRRRESPQHLHNRKSCICSRN